MAATDALFGPGNAAQRQELMTDDVLASLAADIPLTELPHAEADELGIVGVVARAFGTSKGDVRRNLVGYSVGAHRLSELENPAEPGISARLAAAGSRGDTVPTQEWLLLRKGKSSFHLVRLTPSETEVDTVRAVR